MAPRKNILLRERPQPKQVRLPNRRTFYARYERVNRVNLYPTKVRIRRTYVQKICPRKQRRRRQRQLQHESGYVNSHNLIKGINFGKKAASNEVGHMVIDDAVSLLPRVYRPIKNTI